MISSVSLDHQKQHVCLHQLVGHRDVRRGLQFVVIHVAICIVDVSLPAMKFFPVLRERELFTRGCSANENAKPSMREFICGFTKREEPHPKTEHQAKSHLSSTLSWHQMRNMGTPKVSWKSTILNCHEILFHAIRPNEHATKIFKFPQKAYKDTLIIIRYTGTGLSRLWLSYRWFLPECMLIAFYVVVHLLVETVKELWNHFEDWFERQNFAWDKTWSSITDAD